MIFIWLFGFYEWNWFFCFLFFASNWYCERPIRSIHNIILKKSPQKEKVRKTRNKIICSNNKWELKKKRNEQMVLYAAIPDYERDLQLVVNLIKGQFINSTVEGIWNQWNIKYFSIQFNNNLWVHFIWYSWQQETVNNE